MELHRNHGLSVSVLNEVKERLNVIGNSADCCVAKGPPDKPHTGIDLLHGDQSLSQHYNRPICVTKMRRLDIIDTQPS